MYTLRFLDYFQFFACALSYVALLELKVALIEFIENIMLRWSVKKMFITGKINPNTFLHQRSNLFMTGMNAKKKSSKGAIF
jgi:hypothetical protein